VSSGCPEAPETRPATIIMKKNVFIVPRVSLRSASAAALLHRKKAIASVSPVARANRGSAYYNISRNAIGLWRAE